jgi:hypothetical protein
VSILCTLLTADKKGQMNEGNDGIYKPETPGASIEPPRIAE